LGETSELTRDRGKRGELPGLGFGMTFVFNLEHGANDCSGLTVELSGARADV